MTGDPPSAGSLPLSIARRVDGLCERLESGWRTGQPPRIEDLLSDTPEPERSESFRRLLELELELRERNGECPSADEYLSRFPAHASLVALLFRVSASTVGPRRQSVVDGGRPLPRVPGYEVLEELGRGGMGVVFKARQVGLDRVVALKMIRAGDLATPAEEARFREEARAVAKFSHPNIIQVHEVGEHDGRVFFALEYAAGGSLAARLDGAPQDPREAAALVRQLAAAMQAAHERGILHRDLKPANVLLSFSSGSENRPGPICDPPLNDVVPKIADFGLARWLGAERGQTPTGAVVGTPSYMAPEQASGQSLTPAADVYSLGAILYEMLTGRPPFRGRTPLETLEQVRTRDPVAPISLQASCPADLNNIALKCLEKDPTRRYSTAQALTDDLQRFLEGKPVLARPLGWPGRAARWARRNPLASSLLAAVAIVFLAGFAATLWQLRAARANLAEARWQQQRYERAFRQARDAVDAFSEISRRELADRPHTRAARRKLLETALGYYRDFLAERGDDTSLRADLALTQMRLAELTDSLGDRAAAVTLYRAALEVQRGVVADDATDSRQRRHLAGLYTNLANLLRTAGPAPLAEATALYEESLALWENEVKDHPADVGAQRELGRAHLNLGAAHTEARRWPDARRQFQSARDRVGGWSALSPKDVPLRVTLARAARLLGDVLEETGQRDEALRVQQEGVALCEALLREHPRDAAVLRECAFALNDLGILHKRAKQLPAARSAYERAATQYRGLIELDPEDVSLVEGLSGSLYNLGVVLANLNDLPASAAALEEAVTIHRKLVAAAPDDARRRDRLNLRVRDLAAVRGKMREKDGR